MRLTVSKQSKLPSLADSVARLTKARVLVGVPAAKASRKSTAVNNAELMFLHTQGSPAQGIPARPVLQPAIQNAANRETITRQMRMAAQAAFESNEETLRTGLGRAGTAAANAAKGWFTNPENRWAPNSPATVEAKGSDQPLIDTGQLRRSITYVVDEDGDA